MAPAASNPVVYNADARAVYATLSGAVDVGEVKRILEKITEQPGIPDNANAIWDLRAMQIWTVDLDIVRELSDFRNALSDKRQDAKVAMVVSKRHETVIVDMMRAHCRNGEKLFRAFTSYEKAELWVRDGHVQRQKAHPSMH